ncbi:hypothetical protein ACIQWV_20600 [Streptomyces sp. NPDC098085]|uniref:hypothetical protein n=1 Tax=unclassified Streptomyces TaxID=2593676 RepID=UPI003411B6F5
MATNKARHVTASDAARPPGISRTIISFAFAFDERAVAGTPDGTRVRIRASTEELGHRPNGARRRPRLVPADAPTSMPDVSVRVGILNLMCRLWDEHGVSMPYSPHDPASARRPRTCPASTSPPTTTSRSSM